MSKCYIDTYSDYQISRLDKTQDIWLQMLEMTLLHDFKEFDPIGFVTFESEEIHAQYRELGTVDRHF